MSAKHALIIVAAVAALGASTAQAQPGLLVVSGTAGDHERATVSGAIEAAITASGWTLVSKPLSKKESDGLTKCPDLRTPWTCIPASLTSKGVRGAFVISVDRSQDERGTPVVAITGMMITTDPQSFATRERYCELCADDKLVEAGTDVAHQLTRELAKRSGRTVVSIRSTPSTAALNFDGDNVGVTDAKFATYPGHHIAIVQKADYITEIREFDVEEGKTADIVLVLRPSTARDRGTVAPPLESSGKLPIIAIASGGGLMLFGAVSLYQGLHDSPKREYTRATAVGVASSALGLGLVGAGLYLLWRHPSSTSTPTIAPTASGGLTLGWLREF